MQRVVQREGADEAPPPAPQAAHLAALLCEELLPRNVKGAWAKAARAVAALATELGIARDSSPLALAAAVNLLVFERHPPKEKVTDKKIVEESEEQLIDLLKEMMSKVKEQIKNEQREREKAEDALLKLLEETCVRLNQKQQI